MYNVNSFCYKSNASAQAHAHLRIIQVLRVWCKRLIACRIIDCDQTEHGRFAHGTFAMFETAQQTVDNIGHNSQHLRFVQLFDHLRKPYVCARVSVRARTLVVILTAGNNIGGSPALTIGLSVCRLMCGGKCVASVRQHSSAARWTSRDSSL
jgi:hypothetical protein